MAYIPPVWGGREMPIFRFANAGGGSGTLAVAAEDGLPQVFVKVKTVQEEKSINRLASGSKRRRGAGWRMVFEVTLAAYANADVVEFFREALVADHLYLKPRPDGLSWPPPHARSDEWEVVLMNDFDPTYLEDEWHGHEVKFQLESVGEMLKPPIDISTRPFVDSEFTTEAGAAVVTDETGFTYWDEKVFAREEGDGEDTGERDVAFFET